MGFDPESKETTEVNCRTLAGARELVSVGINPYICCQKCCECGIRARVKENSVFPGQCKTADKVA